MHALDLPDPGAAAIDYLANLSRVLDRIPRDQIARAIDALLAARACGSRVYVFGNGGSAATASHFVCDLVKTAQTTGYAPFRAFSMTDNVPLLTAWANDTSYADAFLGWSRRWSSRTTS